MIPDTRRRSFFFACKRIQVFTLIELLIVIVVIAILTAMLLPVLNSARGKARNVHCINNLKQISVALAGYSNDYQEWLIPYRLSRNTSAAHWNGFLSGLDPKNGLIGGGYGTKLGYIKSGTTYKFVNGTFNCASESKPCDTSIPYANSASYHYTHYALNRKGPQTYLTRSIPQKAVCVSKWKPIGIAAAFCSDEREDYISQ